MHVGVRERQRTPGNASRAGGRALADKRSPLGASVRGHEAAAGEPRDRRTAQCCGARCQRRHHGGELGAAPRSSIGGYLGSEGVRPAFVTQSVEKTIRHKVVFNCGNEQVVLWGPPKAKDVKGMALRLKFVTAQAIDRVDAEFGHLRAFRCFDVGEVKKAFECSEPEKARSMQQSLQRHIRHFANLLQVSEGQAGYEYQSIGFHIAQSTRSGRPLATKSNSEVWQSILEPNVCVSHLPQTNKMLFFTVLIRFLPQRRGWRVR